MVVIAIVLFWAAYLVRGTLLLIYVSALLAIGFSPLVRVIERQQMLPVGTRRFPRWLAILVIYLTILGFVTAVGLMVVPPLIGQARELIKELPRLFELLQRWLVEKRILDHELTWQEVVQSAPGDSGDAVGTVLGAVTGVIGGAFGLLTILILTFYLLIDSANIFQTFLRLFPREKRTRIAEASREITVRVSAWLTGQLLLGAIIGASAAIGLWLIGVPYFFVLALICGMGELIPVVGPILSAIPALAVAASVSPQKVLAVLIFFVAQQQFENHVLVPKVMEKQVGVSAVTVIVALMVGASLLGIVGAILAVPTAAILYVMVQQVLGEEETADKS